MAERHCAVNELYAFTLEHRSTWRWLLHPWGVIPSLHILLSSCCVYRCFCRSTASGAVQALIFSWTKKHVRPVLRESWRCRWGQDERNTLTSSAFCRRPARACCSVSIGFTECVITPSVQKQALYDYSTLAARPQSTRYENIWNIRRHKKGKTQGEMSKPFLLLTIYLHSFSHK